MLDDLEFLRGEAWSDEVPLPDDLELLSELGRAEATAIRHLERSNEELLAELQLAEDVDFRAAVEENCSVLQRKYARLAEISERVSLGLLLRARLCVFDCSSGASSSGGCLGAGQGSARDAAMAGSDPAPLSAAAAATAAVAAVTPAAGDDAAATLKRMQTLLRHVKRKASELEDDLMVGDLSGLAIAPHWERKAARLHDSVRPSEDVAAHGAPECSGAESPEGDTAADRADGFLSQLVVPDASAADASPAAAAAVAAERLGALLRGVRRKAAELEEDVVAGSFCGLSLSERPALESPGAAPDSDAKRWETSHPRPRTRPRTGSTP